VSAMRRTLVFAAASAVVAVVSPVASSSPVRTTVEHQVVLERAVVRELNRTRSAHGLRRLRFGGGLDVAAAQHSRSMLELGYFDHSSPDGTTFDRRIRRYYSTNGWRRWVVGEALLSSSIEISAREIVQAWVDSPPHREVILSPVYRDGGLAVYYAPAASGAFGGEPAIVVTADFGLRER
jgi:uncharacterized protein YkwD